MRRSTIRRSAVAVVATAMALGVVAGASGTAIAAEPSATSVAPAAQQDPDTDADGLLEEVLEVLLGPQVEL